jgi:ABC-type multidrug transport system fused ATPase/permease subunit
MAINLLIDRIVQRARDEGAFDNLRGTGRPLVLDENPFEDPAMRVVHRFLRNNGMSLPWIEAGNEIALQIDKAHLELEGACRKYWDAADSEQPDAKEQWERALDDFRSRIALLNKRLLIRNLSVPSIHFQRPLLQVDREIARITNAVAVRRVSLPAPTTRAAAAQKQSEGLTFGAYREQLATYLAPQRRKVALLTILLFSSIIFQLINPQFLRSFIDAATSGVTSGQLTNAALLFIGFALVGQLLTVLATYFSEDVAWTSTNALRADLTLHCLRLDMPFHKTRTPGELIERVDGDVAALANFFSQFVIRVLGNGVLLLGVLALVAWEDWRAGLALLGYVLVTLEVLRRMQGIAVPHLRASRQATADIQSFWEERLGGTADIRANGGISYVMRRNYELLRTAMRQGIRATMIYRTFIGVWIIVFLLGNALALAVGAYLFRADLMTIGGVYLIFHYTNMVSMNLLTITEQFNDLQNATAGIQRINELYHTGSRLRDGHTLLPAGPLAVQFRDVTFGYDDERRMTNDGGRTTNDERRRTNDGRRRRTHDNLQSPISNSLTLDGVSFYLQPGQTLGLLGRTGSGKTTIARLLFRFYDPSWGAIRLGGADLRALQLADVRTRVGMVTQDVQLFHASVRDNLTFWNQTISDERILEVLETLGLMPWLQSLPNGLDSELASGGASLSAGEAQLLAFARVFLQDPGLVILDEASARLDPATEALIERAIDRLLEGRTAIIIAHRLRTVQRADDILILDHGHVLEYGPRAQLAADPTSHFHRLLRVGLEEITSGVRGQGSGVRKT